jgi:hypothetical protein
MHPPASGIADNRYSAQIEIALADWLRLNRFGRGYDTMVAGCEPNA